MHEVPRHVLLATSYLSLMSHFFLGLPAECGDGGSRGRESKEEVLGGKLSCPLGWPHFKNYLAFLHHQLLVSPAPW